MEPNVKLAGLDKIYISLLLTENNTKWSTKNASEIWVSNWLHTMTGSRTYCTAVDSTYQRRQPFICWINKEVLLVLCFLMSTIYEQRWGLYSQHKIQSRRLMRFHRPYTHFLKFRHNKFATRPSNSGFLPNRFFYSTKKNSYSLCCIDCATFGHNKIKSLYDFKVSIADTVI